MNQMSDTNYKPLKTSGYEDHSLLDLIWEMKLLNMDPNPLLEVAANDIIVKHGAKALRYVQRMQEQVTKDNHQSGIYLWNTLCSIITMRFLTLPTVIH